MNLNQNVSIIDFLGKNSLITIIQSLPVSKALGHAHWGEIQIYLEQEVHIEKSSEEIIPCILFRMTLPWKDTHHNLGQN